MPLTRPHLLIVLFASLACGPAAPSTARPAVAPAAEVPPAAAVDEAAAASRGPANPRADITALCDEIARRYIYLPDKVSDWAHCVEIYGPLAAATEDEPAFLHVAEQVIAELYDDHAGLRAHAEGSPLLVPTHADIWIEIEGGRPIVTSVREDSPAAKAGVQAGSQLVSVSGRDVAAVLESHPRRLGPVHRDAADAYTLRVALAGVRGQPQRTFELVDPHGKRRAFNLPTLAGAPAPEGLVSHRHLDEDLGYIRIHNSLGDPELVSAFDAALDDLLDTKGLVLDLRQTPSGGGSGIAEPIMARLVSEEVPYQRMRWLAGRGDSPFEHLSVDHIVPRTDKPTYRRPMVILVSRWTGSMGEGISIGLEGAGRATLVGTAMAGLGGAVGVFEMPTSGVGFQFPIRQIDHVDGTPRQTRRPGVEVDMRTATGADPILEAGVGTLRVTVRSLAPRRAPPRNRLRPS